MIRCIIRCGKYLSFSIIIIWITVLIYTLLKILYNTKNPRYAEYYVHPRNFALYLQPTVFHKPQSITSLQFKHNAIHIKKDWHDYNFIEYEKNRMGFGEHGEPVSLGDEYNDASVKLFKLNGFNALLSDHISVNRSVPDIRHKNCQSKKYLSTLPSVSIIIPFYNEHLSTLLRSLHSIINRTPPTLLHEIIIIDDYSDKGNLNLAHSYSSF